jgi:hypothetical protein
MIVTTLCVVTLLWTLRVLLSTRSVGGCMPTRSEGTIMRNTVRGRELARDDRSHAPRGNAAVDAPRPVVDVERRGLHAHAERGHDQIRNTAPSHVLCLSRRLNNPEKPA